jgi:hypothetical protein
MGAPKILIRNLTGGLFEKKKGFSPIKLFSDKTYIFQKVYLLLRKPFSQVLSIKPLICYLLPCIYSICPTI